MLFLLLLYVGGCWLVKTLTPSTQVQILVPQPIKSKGCSFITATIFFIQSWHIFTKTSNIPRTPDRADFVLMPFVGGALAAKGVALCLP